MTVILSGLQMMPNESNNTVLQWLNTYLYWIAGTSAVIVLHIIDLYRGRERHIKEWLVTFLKHILDEHLAGEIYHTRISILRVERRYKVFFKSLFHFVFRNFCNNFKNATWKNSFKDIAVHIMSDYVYFRLSDKANRNQFNGIANKCLEEGVSQFVHTIDISGIDVTRSFDKLSSNEKNKVRKYMKESYFASSFYSSLRLMHRISNNLYAVPIALSDQSIWGVVVIECKQ